jgi:pimeloyl-ACP methyl ester carboxylesterase
MAAVADLATFGPVEMPRESLGDRLFTQLGTGIDVALLAAMRLVVDAVMMPKPAELPAMRAAASALREGELGREPRRFFSFLEAPVPETTVTGRFRRKLPGGLVVRREFESRYRPYLTDAASAAESGQERIPVEHWMHEPLRPLGTIVALHGFSMGMPLIDAFALMATQWFQRGLDVALVTLPFHGVRTPPEARFSGERFAAPNPKELSEAVRRAVYEIRLVTHWLREQSGAPVGLLGLSLGGYLSSLMAGLVDDLDFVVPMVPPVCIGDLAWRFFEQSRRNPAAAMPAFDREELRGAYRLHSPLTYPLRVSRERVLIVAGRGDRVVPPEHPHALWKHWEKPSIHWFSGSHVAPFRRGRIIAAIVEHLEKLDVL